ncbi:MULTISPECIES: universal stress protein [Streptomyces]|uniref:Universal stress protein n=1 Tax=Streptomyces xanthochromogenes TaxID=67384 RepID=A0ABQ2ZHB6_9ACTN|nr:universal stress protein [Streptomyces xanthochromogenes]MYV92551.1 universal stress protein [Streptomyces sp. SID1034]GGY15203.1 universal stress protein [Streptomyces xanthochromogenes]
MDKPVIVGVDGSDPSLRALDWATDEAALHGLPLCVVHSQAWGWYEGYGPSLTTDRSALRAYGENLVESAVERVGRRAAAVKAYGELVVEDPAAVLTRLSREAFAVVVGGLGAGGIAGLPLGSVGLAVAARARSPVIVVRGNERHLRRGYGRIAAGVDAPEQVDAPEEAGPVVEFAFGEAEAWGAALVAVHAWRCPARDVADHPDHRGDVERHRVLAQDVLTEALRPITRVAGKVEVRPQVIEGHVRKALLDTALTADLLVVGVRRRKSHLGMQLGPVNHAVLHQAACPVAVIPHA